MLGRDAAAGVVDADADIVAGGQIGDLGLVEGDVVDLDAEVAAPAHRVARVDGEIEDRILELGRIGPDVPGLGRRSGCGR